MPIHEYRCHNCGAEKEEYFRLLEHPSEMPCLCGDTMKLQFSAPGGIKIGACIMSVAKKWRPDMTANENWYRCAQTAEAHGIKPPDSPETKMVESRVMREAKAKGW